MLKFTMIKEILQFGDPTLTSPTSPIKDINSKETRQLIRDLLDTCKKNADISAGLAAPQIGVSKSICVCRRVDLEAEAQEQGIDDESLWEVLINPRIIKKSHTTSTEWEACLSIGSGNDNIWAPVIRSKKVTVEFTTPEGKTKTLTAENYFSHIVQHELDHLKGILFISYITNPQNLWRLEDLNKYINKHDSYPDMV